ncbi:unnamed protein product [Rotaria magnacalcarata]|uniref:Helix-turn-helix domain-containing protein n=2 Tax=Rotaria magnacalcarata TaxID=392030 RepID=A0A815Z6H0_9BILA|nr:unnamed protein product [Rotaria magnacalcarata]CAF4105037.1 unnamed protein product [Rotaria magnacalcarata]CAF4180952.1 unnamed protein product [Rotaria magnacalcarata]
MLTIQFIYHPCVASIETYLMAFDSDVIHICFNGENVLSTWTFIRALNTGTFICYNLTNDVNSNGALKTSAYYKEAAEPYVVSFISDHPDHVFRNTIDTAITRAVSYSTTLSQFEEEIRQMKLMFLYNGYPPRNIDRQLTKLFSKYLSKHFILPMLYNSGDFGYLRH